MIALLGATLLLVAELSPLYTVVVGALQTPRRSISSGSNHGYALALVALAAVAMALLTLRGSRAAAGALVALGAVALLVALAIDLPDTRRSGSLREAVAFQDARAKAGRGLGLELAGAITLLVAGAGLLLTATAAAGRAPGRPAREGNTEGRGSANAADGEGALGSGPGVPAREQRTARERAAERAARRSA